MSEKPVEFLRKKDFVLKQELGQGACGRTVLLYDPIIEENFVCKKYSPIHESLKEELFNGFVKEIKFLHLLNHPNVVRVFNYYLYPENKTGYILMEYVLGSDIEDFLKAYPEEINKIFNQVIEGFNHLETSKILHRDIRPQNIMVNNIGQVKIIDFGFGKQTANSNDFNKSISLNWWCELPDEFASSTYDYQTEVYFIGKLFEKIIIDNHIEQFKYMPLLRRMTPINPNNRLATFSEVRKELLNEKFLEIEFDGNDLWAYREFSSCLSQLVSKMEQNTKYYDDVEEIQSKLENCFKKIMLEEFLESPPLLISCFINGTYFFQKSFRVEVATIKAFLDLFRSSSKEKKNIILSNIQTRLDSVTRYSKALEFDDDIPF